MSWSHEHADGEIWTHDNGHACDGSDFPALPLMDTFQFQPSDDWAVNMYIRTNNTKKADEAYWELCKLSRDLRPKNLDHVGVSCYRITEEDEEPDTDEPMTEFHDENTLVKVKDALLEGLGSIDTGYPRDALVMELITSMQNAGILFRERNI